MFGGKKEKSKKAGVGGTTLLARSVQVVGDVKFSGHLEVEGRVSGNIDAEEGSDARVRVLDQGVVEGEICAPNVVINGHVTGDVRATKHLELAAQAVVNGNVYYQVIEMVKGAQVNGNLVHIRDTSEDSKRPKQEKKAGSDPIAQSSAQQDKAGAAGEKGQQSA